MPSFVGAHDLEPVAAGHDATVAKGAAHGFKKQFPPEGRAFVKMHLHGGGFGSPGSGPVLRLRVTRLAAVY